MKIQKYIDASPVFAIAVSYTQILRDINERLNCEKLNFLQALILVSLYVEESKPVLPSILAKTFRTSPGNISHCVTHLAKLGLVKRELDPKDARSYRIIIKPEGRRVAVRLIKFFDQLQTVLEKEVGEDTILGTITTIQRMEQVYSRFES